MGLYPVLKNFNQPLASQDHIRSYKPQGVVIRDHLPIVIHSHVTGLTLQVPLPEVLLRAFGPLSRMCRVGPGAQGLGRPDLVGGPLRGSGVCLHKGGEGPGSAFVGMAGAKRVLAIRAIDRHTTGRARRALARCAA